MAPSVALAVTNTVSNLALAIAIGQGVAITWWRKVHECPLRCGHTFTDNNQALKGATVEDLHKSWSFSTSVLELLTAGKSFNLIALCALTAKMALVDNLLLQKAAGSAPSTYEQSGIKLRLPTWQQQLPSNYVGTFNANGTVGAFSSNFSYILHDYASNGAFIQADSFDMFAEFTSTCTGTCFARVPGYVLLNKPFSSCFESQPRIKRHHSGFIKPVYFGPANLNSILKNFWRLQEMIVPDIAR